MIGKRISRLVIDLNFLLGKYELLANWLKAVFHGHGRKNMGSLSCLTVTFSLSCLFLMNSLLARAQINVDSVQQILNTKKISVSQKINLLNALAAYYNPDSTNQGLVFANQAYLLALKENDKYRQGTSLLNLAEGYLYNDSYDQALQYAFNALDIFLSLKNDSPLAECYRLLGWIFYDSENADFALQYHQMSNRLYVKLKDEKNTGISFNAIGLVFQMKNETDSSKKYFEKALTIANQLHNVTASAAALNNIGICENNLKNYPSAILYFTKALAVSKTSGKPLSEAETLNQLAYSQLMLRNFGQSKKMLQQSEQLIESSTSSTRKEKLLDNLNISSQLNEALGNYAAALQNLREYTTTRNEIVSRTKSDAVAASQLKRETVENETQIKSILAQRELRSFQRNALATVVVLLLIIGFLLFSRLRQKQKREKELHDMRQALMKKELDNTLLEKESLKNKLEYKEAELKNYALYISQRNELIRSFIDELNLLRVDEKTYVTKFNGLLNKFQYDLEINKEAQDFNITIEEMHKDFFYNLLKRFPNLTVNERRLCAQIRLNLSIKDIASLNNISVKSAEMARYRLRKHFELLHEENLNEFLKSF